MHRSGTMKDNIVDELNKLIQLDFDASKTYEQALEHAEDDEQVREDLTAFRADHLRHIGDLGIVIRRLRGEPIEPNRDVKGVLLEGMTKLRSVTGVKGALKAMRMNEKLTNKTYDKASEMDLPAEVRAVIDANLADERRHLATIDAHLERLGVDIGDADDELLDRTSPSHTEARP